MPRFQIVLKIKRMIKTPVHSLTFSFSPINSSSLYLACQLPDFSLTCAALTSLHLAALYSQESHSWHLTAVAELLLPASPGNFCLTLLFLTHLFLTSSIFDDTNTYSYLIFRLFYALFHSGYFFTLFFTTWQHESDNHRDPLSGRK